MRHLVYDGRPKIEICASPAPLSIQMTLHIPVSLLKVVWIERVINWTAYAPVDRA